jgi:hypothetical protein
MFYKAFSGSNVVTLSVCAELTLFNEGKSAVSFCHQVSISPTFYEQLLHQNPFAKKLQAQVVST